METVPSAPPAAPPVVAVIVTHDPGPWFDDTLRAFGAQDYPNLTVLIIDAGSTLDPTPRVAAILPQALVRTLSKNVGFAAACSGVIGTVQGATHVVLCHDDVAPDPDAIRLMVEEAYRSNAGIVGPKLVSWDDPERILSVGAAVDRTGARAPLVEPGELDQGQHDRVRDVFVVPSACTLVRLDMFSTLGGFDSKIPVWGEDLNLCWRAQVAGARVLVAPVARVRHRESAQLRDGTVPFVQGSKAELERRHRLRTLLVCSGRMSRALGVMQLGLVTVFAIVHALVKGRRALVRAHVNAWKWNLANRRDNKAARRKLTSIRKLTDKQLRAQQIRGSAPLNAFVRGQWDGQDTDGNGIDQGFGPFARRILRIAASVSPRRHGRFATFAVLGLVTAFVLGSRGLLTDGLPRLGEFMPATETSTLLRDATTSWRSWGVGGEGATSPAIGFVGLLSAALLGSPGLAMFLVTVGLIPLGWWAMWRASTPLGRSQSRVVAVIAYAIVPFPYVAVVNGSWSVLAAYAAAPALVMALARATGIEPYQRVVGKARIAQLLSIGLITAAAASVNPILLALPVIIGVGQVLASVFVGGIGASIRALFVAVGATAVGMVLLAPWLVTLAANGGLDAFGSAIDPSIAPTFLELLTGDGGQVASARWARLLLLVAAGLPFVIASGARLGWATRRWIVAVFSAAVAWLAGLGYLAVPVAQPMALAIPAAASLALATGLGAVAFDRDLRRFRFGVRQLATPIAALALAVATLPIIGSAVDGRWEAPRSTALTLVDWLPAPEIDGTYRVLWLGETSNLPGSAWPAADGLSWTMSQNGQPDLRSVVGDNPGESGSLITTALDDARSGRTERLGSIIGPMGVRYIVVVRSRLPAGVGDEALAIDDRLPAGLVDNLSSQVDLGRIGSDSSLVVFENSSWTPVQAIFTSDSGIFTSDPLSVRALGLPSSEPVLRTATRGNFEGDVPSGVTVWTGSANAQRWTLNVDGAAVPRSDALGWGSTYAVGAGGPSRLQHDTPIWFTGVVVGQLLLILAAITLSRRWRTRNSSRHSDDTIIDLAAEERRARERRDKRTHFAEELAEEWT